MTFGPLAQDWHFFPVLAENSASRGLSASARSY
jgi:hypothetical protein